MGKRELLLILAFLVVGAVVYRVSAPPAEPGKGGFSFSGMANQIETAVKGERVELAVIRRASLADVTPHKPLSLTSYRGSVTIIGEGRDTIEAELRATAYGVDEAAARTTADQLTVTLEPRDDRVDVVLPQSSKGRRPRFELTLRVPSDQVITLGLDRGEAEVRGVEAITLDDGRGKVVITDATRIEGQFQGDLTVQGADTVKVEVRRGRVRIDDVRGQLEVNAEGGELTINKIGGPTKLTLKELRCNVEDVDGSILVEGERARLEVRTPRGPVTVSLSDSNITLVLADAIPATISNSDGPVEVRLPRDGMTVDAIAREGEIRPADHRLHVIVDDKTQKLTGPIGGGGPLLKLRNENGPIFIR